ncbi:MAG: nucleotidyltransferase [Bacteroidetes bacterium]|nr:nucleotidyltransferase [Bacteroidota bacterium]
MNLILPMAGQGKRLRPHTLNKPKALLPIAGKTIIQRIIEEITKSLNKKIKNIGFIVNDVNDDINNLLLEISRQNDVNPKIYVQEEPLGTAHAIYQAKDLLEGEALVIFSDTLFKANLKIENNVDSIVWTKKVPNPSAFGVVKLDENGFIKNFIEKPQINISNDAMIGIYYFKQSENLKSIISTLLKTEDKTQGEYQLTTALLMMIEQGKKMITKNVTEWMDCGNKESIIKTHKIILDHIDQPSKLVNLDAKIYNSIIVPPVYIGKNSIIHNSVIGPYVSIGENTNVYDSRIQNSVVQNNSNIKNINLNDAMLGSYVNFIGKPTNANVGDYSNTIIN